MPAIEILFLFYLIYLVYCNFNNLKPVKRQARDLAIFGTEDNKSFYFELLEFYKKNKRKINKSLRIKNENSILDFCYSKLELKYENLCKLAFIFANVTNKQMPDHIHARLVFGSSNYFVQEYIKFTAQPELKRKNIFIRHTLLGDGYSPKLRTM